MTHPRASSLVSVVLVGASLSLAPIEVHAGPGADEVARPVEGPARPPAPSPETPPGEQPVEPETPPGVIPPPPSFDPGGAPGIEFVVPPPESDAQPDAQDESPLAAVWPDPGMAPNDGNSMLVLSGTTIGLTLVAFSAGVGIGLDREVPLEALLPGAIIPAAGILAFSAGGLYLGIKRAAAHHRWELAYRVVGEPQGGGLNIGATFMLLGALFSIPAGAFGLDRGDDVTFSTSLIVVGSAAAITTPIMYTLAARRKRSYERTGGWHRRPMPPIPGEEESWLHISPIVAPTFGGITVGARGQF